MRVNRDYIDDDKPLYFAMEVTNSETGNVFFSSSLGTLEETVERVHWFSALNELSGMKINIRIGKVV